MPKRSWNKVRPTSLRNAMELCIEYARERHNRSVERIADLMGLKSHWVLYKWMQEGAIPANRLRPFEFACDSTFVTQYIAASAQRLLITIPNGRKADDQDIHDVQLAANDAIGHLLRYYRGESSADDTLAAIDRAMGGLAWQRANVDSGEQPSLELEDDSELQP